MRHFFLARIRLFAFSLLILGQRALASPSNSTIEACADIATSLPDEVSYPAELRYTEETQKYWSTVLRALEPACIVFPTSASDVSKIVQILNNYTDVDFAIKSGGHDPNPGHASIQDGVLVAMREISGATYDDSTGLASVKPGGTWNDVIGDLEPYGVTIAGGRLGIVGVGGYLLQGGISFLSAQVGLAADNIVGWETVMPNGSIVNVDASTDPSLAVAMRGSGSQFGIVTQFTIQAYPTNEVWGGSRIYAATAADDLYAALHQFVPNGVEDPKAAIIFTDSVEVYELGTFIVYYFYNGSTPPTEGPLAAFLDIDPLLDLTSTQTYASLLEANGAPAELIQERVHFRSFTIPYIPSYSGLYADIMAKYKSLHEDYLDNLLHATSQCSIDFQPLPSLIGQHSEARGGNAMGLSGSDPDRLILELECLWASEEDDALMLQYVHEMTDWLSSQMPTWVGMANVSVDYFPYFMNDAMGDQGVTQSYRGYEAFKALQEEIDPTGLLSRRAGGFKY